MDSNADSSLGPGNMARNFVSCQAPFRSDAQKLQRLMLQAPSLENAQVIACDIKRHIHQTRPYIRTTPSFVKRTYKKLIYAHNYNCKIAKVHKMYPLDETFRSLLISHIKLEMDVLNNPEYNTDPYITSIEIRLLTLLSTVYSKYCSYNKVTDRFNPNDVWKSILLLFEDVPLNVHEAFENIRIKVKNKINISKEKLMFGHVVFSPIKTSWQPNDSSEDNCDEDQDALQMCYKKFGIIASQCQHGESSVNTAPPADFENDKNLINLYEEEEELRCLQEAQEKIFSTEKSTVFPLIDLTNNDKPITPRLLANTTIDLLEDSDSNPCSENLTLILKQSATDVNKNLNSDCSDNAVIVRSDQLIMQQLEEFWKSGQSQISIKKVNESIVLSAATPQAKNCDMQLSRRSDVTSEFRVEDSDQIRMETDCGRSTGISMADDATASAFRIYKSVGSDGSHCKQSDVLKSQYAHKFADSQDYEKTDDSKESDNTAAKSDVKTSSFEASKFEDKNGSAREKEDFVETFTEQEHKNKDAEEQTLFSDHTKDLLIELDRVINEGEESIKQIQQDACNNSEIGDQGDCRSVPADQVNQHLFNYEEQVFIENIILTKENGSSEIPTVKEDAKESGKVGISRCTLSKSKEERANGASLKEDLDLPNEDHSPSSHGSIPDNHCRNEDIAEADDLPFLETGSTHGQEELSLAKINTEENCSENKEINTVECVGVEDNPEKNDSRNTEFKENDSESLEDHCFGIEDTQEVMALKNLITEPFDLSIKQKSSLENSQTVYPRRKLADIQMKKLPKKSFHLNQIRNEESLRAWQPMDDSKKILKKEVVHNKATLDSTGPINSIVDSDKVYYQVKLQCDRKAVDMTKSTSFGKLFFTKIAGEENPSQEKNNISVKRKRSTICSPLTIGKINCVYQEFDMKRQKFEPKPGESKKPFGVNLSGETENMVQNSPKAKKRGSKVKKVTEPKKYVAKGPKSHLKPNLVEAKVKKPISVKKPKIGKKELVLDEGNSCTLSIAKGETENMVQNSPKDEKRGSNGKKVTKPKKYVAKGPKSHLKPNLVGAKAKKPVKEPKICKQEDLELNEGNSSALSIAKGETENMVQNCPKDKKVTKPKKSVAKGPKSHLKPNLIGAKAKKSVKEPKICKQKELELNKGNSSALFIAKGETENKNENSPKDKKRGSKEKKLTKPKKSVAKGPKSHLKPNLVGAKAKEPIPIKEPKIFKQEELGLNKGNSSAFSIAKGETVNMIENSPKDKKPSSKGKKVTKPKKSATQGSKSHLKPNLVGAKAKKSVKEPKICKQKELELNKGNSNALFIAKGETDNMNENSPKDKKRGSKEKKVTKPKKYVAKGEKSHLKPNLVGAKAKKSVKEPKICKQKELELNKGNSNALFIAKGETDNMNENSPKDKKRGSKEKKVTKPKKYVAKGEKSHLKPNLVGAKAKKSVKEPKICKQKELELNKGNSNALFIAKGETDNMNEHSPKDKKRGSKEKKVTKPKKYVAKGEKSHLKPNLVGAKAKKPITVKQEEELEINKGNCSALSIAKGETETMIENSPEDKKRSSKGKKVTKPKKSVAKGPKSHLKPNLVRAKVKKLIPVKKAKICKQNLKDPISLHEALEQFARDSSSLRQLSRTRPSLAKRQKFNVK